MSAIPQEVIEAIIDALWADQKALRQCALTCRTWLPRARYRLFRRATLRRTDQLARFSRALQASRESLGLVNELILTAHGPALPSLVSSAFAILAGRLPQLEKLRISVQDDHSVRSAEACRLNISRRTISHITHFRMLTRLELCSLELSSFMDLGRIIVRLPRLTVLSLIQVSWHHVGRIPPVSPLTKVGGLSLENITVIGLWTSMPGISNLFLAASPRGLKTLGLDLSAAASSECESLLRYGIALVVTRERGHPVPRCPATVYMPRRTTLPLYRPRVGHERRDIPTHRRERAGHGSYSCLEDRPLQPRTADTQRSWPQGSQRGQTHRPL
ncbi:hypothetical protein OH77DRAFT_1398326 [Trametes cingulata]|nr:hypothetical protein OH77DRAFT_1398326 [Trametes cingulata]